MWITHSEFVNLTGLDSEEINPEMIDEALAISSARIRELVLIRKEYKAYSARDRHRLLLKGLWLAAIEGDQVTKDDLYAYEEDNNTGERTDVGDLIVDFHYDSGNVYFAEDVPHNPNKKLVIEYWLGKFRWQTEYPLLRELQRWMTIDILFTHIPFKQLQEGIASWSINSVSVTEGSGSILSVHDKIQERINYLVQVLQPPYMRDFPW
jgi:hypothetical protein